MKNVDMNPRYDERVQIYSEDISPQLALSVLRLPVHPSRLLDRAKASRTILPRKRRTATADVADLGQGAVSGARRGAHGALPLEGVEYLQSAPATLTLTLHIVQSPPPGVGGGDCGR